MSLPLSILCSFCISSFIPCAFFSLFTEFSVYPSPPLGDHMFPLRFDVCETDCIVFLTRSVYLILLRCLQLGPHVITIFPTDVVRQAQSPLASLEDMFHCDSGFNGVLLSPRAAVVSDRITASAVTTVYIQDKNRCVISGY
jgi:hypothetical protein